VLTVSWDTETELITDLVKVPPLVCVSAAWDFEGHLETQLTKWDDQRTLDDVADFYEHCLSTGANIAFDSAVVMRQWPELTPLVFDAYEHNRVLDTIPVQKLIDIAHGELHRAPKPVNGTNYSLAAMAWRHLGRVLDKETWRGGYGALRDVPLAEWPEGARRYPIDDAVANLEVHEAQRLGWPELLADQFRQSRHAFWLYLVGAWGIRTDVARVRRFEQQLLDERSDHFKTLRAAGLIKPKRKSEPDGDQVLCDKLGRERMARVYPAGPRTPPSTTHPAGQASVDYQTCVDCGDPVMLAFGEYASVRKQLTADVPHLLAGELHCRFDSLKETGRTGCSDPYNLQNPPRETGVRECFVPRLGTVFVDCLVPGSRLLKVDLTWSPVEDLKVGEELIGFDEVLEGRKTKFRAAVVEHVGIAEHPCYRIVTNYGEVTCSASHQWVANGKGHRGYKRMRNWMPTQELRVGDTISFMTQPWTVEETQEAGYLAGFFDGEGNNHFGTIGWGQNPGAVSTYVQDLLTARGFKWGKYRSNTRCEKFEILGGRAQGLRFLGMIRPRRLLEKQRLGWEGCQTWGKRSSPARILAIEYVGLRDTISIKTSTGTFIAEGMLSHNCDYDGLESRAGAQACLDLVGESTMADVLNAGEDLHLHMAAALLKCDYATVLARYQGHALYKKAGGREGKKDTDASDARQFAKIANFGLSGGMGADKFYEHAQKELKKVGATDLARAITWEQCAEIRETWRRRWREWPRYFARTGELCGDGPATAEQLYVGRYRGGLGYTDMNNTYFQGLGADAAKAAGWRIVRACYDWTVGSVLYGSRVVNFVHDQFLVEVPTSVAHNCALVVAQIMVSEAAPFFPDVPATVTPCLATCWSKDAKACYGSDGRLVPWSPEEIA